MKHLLIIIIAVLALSCEKRIEVIPYVDYATESFRGQQDLIDEAMEPYVMCNNLIVKPKVFLQGCYDPQTGVMYDSLRSKGYIPYLASYYYSQNDTLNNAVDWVKVQLLSNDSTVIAAKWGILQRDGDVRRANGSSIDFDKPPGYYYLRILHRNHIDIMTPQAIYMSNTTYVDFTTSQSWGTYGQALLEGSVYGMWMGDVNGDEKSIYSGPSNDIADIQSAVITLGNGLSNYILYGYQNSDVNLDGVTIFSGQTNDPTLIFNNVLTHPGNVGLPNYIIQEQLP